MYKVEIRRNSDGVVRDYSEDVPWDDCSDYMWSDGNYGCDCNRGLFFDRAANEENDDVPCGTSQFSVRITAEDGSLLYQDDAFIAPEKIS